MVRSIVQRPTYAEIDLDYLANNFSEARRSIGRDVNYMAIVKANAYGHGAIECARRLEREGVDWFGVAIPEEGVELRKAGIRNPILCLGSFWPGQEVTIVVHDITPVVFDESAAETLNSVAAAAEKVVDIHVKIDTGMGRVGIRYDEAASLARSLSRFKNLRVTGLMTHFAAADDPEQTAFTRLQIERFDAVCDEFRRADHEPRIFDLANSPGALSHPDSRGNMVRLGGALYGLLDDIMPNATSLPDLKPVLSLHSRIAQIKRVPVGESLGYGRTFTTARDSLIALVPIGYADGYSRRLSNRGKAIVTNKSIVPVVGRVSMDWTLLDVTDVDNVTVNDAVILIGSDSHNAITAADVARELDTIGYEVTCRISSRVPRRFQIK